MNIIVSKEDKEYIEESLKSGEVLKEDLTRWFKEKWVDVSKKVNGKHPPCGRKDADGKSYPKCRPSKKVSKETPKVASSYDKKEKKAMTSQKRRAEKEDPKVGKGNKPTMTKFDEQSSVDERSRSFAFTRKKRLFSQPERMSNPHRYREVDRLSESVEKRTVIQISEEQFERLFEYNEETPVLIYEDEDGSLWIIREDSVNQIGCIHTCQGLEVDYVGVIIGPDMVIRNGSWVCQPERRAKSDKSIQGWKSLAKKDSEKSKSLTDLIIKNIGKKMLIKIIAVMIATCVFIFLCFNFYFVVRESQFHCGVAH